MRIRYIRSLASALAVGGLLSATPLLAQDNSASNMNQDQIKQVQQDLKQKGYDTGKVDGIMGQHTAQAIRDFQKDQGQPVTGQLDQKTLSSLGVQGGSATSKQQAGTASQGTQPSDQSQAQGQDQTQGSQGGNVGTDTSGAQSGTAGSDTAGGGGGGSMGGGGSTSGGAGGGS